LVYKNEAGVDVNGEVISITGSELYKLCLDRDEEAWAYLFSWCLKRAKRKLPSQAEDVAQQVCIKMLGGGLKSVRNPKAFYGFMATAVDRAAIDAARKLGREVSLDNPLPGTGSAGSTFVDHMPAGTSDPDHQAAARVALERLADAITQLPEYCHRVVPLYIRYKMGLTASYETMADELGIPLNTLSVQIRRCLQGLRKMPEFSWISDKGDKQ
jgi:RNA polymerase sigma factor (sigma-70 family)